MVAEFTVVRDTVKYHFGAVLETAERAFRVDARTTPRTSSGTSIFDTDVSDNTGGGTSHLYVNYVRSYCIATGAAPRNNYLNYVMIYNQRAATGSYNWYGSYIINAPLVDYVGTSPTTVYGMHINLGYANPLPVTAQAIRMNVINVLYDDNNAVALNHGPRIIDALLRYRTDSLGDLNLLYPMVTIYTSQTSGSRCGVYSCDLTLQAGVSLNFDITTFVQSHLVMVATSTILKSFSFTFFDSTTDVKGTITEECSGHRVEWHAGSTVTCRNLLAFYAYWDVSGATVSQQAAAFMAEINGNNRSFTISGSCIVITGIIGADALWRGYYLNADGVTCGVGETFFGVQLDMDGMTSGGSVVGYNVNQLPANSTLHLIGTATVPIGSWSVYNASNSPNFELGPDLLISVKKEDNFTGLTWGATGVWAVGQKWRATIAAGGSVTLVSPAAGGIVALFAPVLAGPNSPTFLDENNILGWRLQERPVLYTRWRVVQDGYIRAAVGWTDDVAEGIADPMPYTSDAVLAIVDTAVGAFFYLVGVRATVRVNVSSNVALDTNHHRFMIIPKYTTAGAFDGMDLFMDDIYRCSLTAAQCPVETTMMQCLSGYVQNLAAGAADKHQRVDKATFGELTNVGLGDT